MHHQLHPAQLAVLETLRHRPEATFSELMKSTPLTSDSFKFHLRALAKHDYIKKNPNGAYALTAPGKEFANKLNRAERQPKKQPKLSMLILAVRHNPEGGKTEYLMQQRRRQPYYGFWGCISGPVLWGESYEEAAAREFTKQTGLTAQHHVRSFYRELSRNKETHEVLEDNVFVVIEALDVQGELSNAWQGGHNEWMSQDDFLRQDHYFSTTHNAINILRRGVAHTTSTALYQTSEY